MATLQDLLVKVGVDDKGVDRGTKSIEGKIEKSWGRISSRLDSVMANARKGMSGLALVGAGLGPAIVPAIAAATGVVLGLGAAMAGAGAAAGVFGAVLGTAFSEVKEASKKSQDLVDKIALLEERIRVANATGVGDAGKLEKARITALNELMARYGQMPPALQKVTGAYDDMRISWTKFVERNKPATYKVMTGAFNTLTRIIPKLQPLFDVAADAAGRLVTYLTRVAAGGGMDRFVKWLTAQAGPALTNLGTIGRNLAVVVGNLSNRFDTTGQGVLAWIAEVTTRWAAWSEQTDGGGLQGFFDNVQQHGPQVFELLSSLATAAVNIAQATAPLAPISLAIAGALASILAALPPGVITTLVAAWIAYSVALKGYRVAIAAAGVATDIAGNKAIKKLAGWMAAGVRWSASMIASAAKVTAGWVASAARATAAMAVTVARTVAGWAVMAASAMASALVIAAAWILANLPLVLIIAAIVAVIAIFVLLWNKCDWFRNFWIAAWDMIWGAIKFVFNWIKDNWKLLLAIITGPVGMAVFLITKYWDQIKAGATAAKDWVAGKFNALLSFITGMKSKVTNGARGLWDGLVSAFKSSINRLISMWNNFQLTLGGGSVLGMGIPSVTLRTPNIPMLANGGIVPATPGGRLAVLGEGGHDEAVVPLPRGARDLGRDGGRPTVFEVRGDGSRASALVLELMRGAIRPLGGDVQVVVGSSR